MAQDYILRLVEQVARMLAATVAHKEAGRHAEAAFEIEANCLRTVGLPLESVRRTSPEALWQHLQQSGGLCYTRAVTLAEFLLHDVELSKIADRPADAILSQLHAFCLLTESIKVLSADEVAVYRPRIEALARELEASSKDPYLQQRIHAYRAQRTT